MRNTSFLTRMLKGDSNALGTHLFLIFKFVIPFVFIFTSGKILCGAQVSGFVDSITVIGNVTVSKNTIIQQMETRPGGVFNENKISRDLKNILKLPEIFDVSWRASDKDGNVALEIEVRESPKLNSISFVGNKTFTRKKLIEKVSLEENNYFDPYRIKRGVSELKSFYLEEGYYSVSVSLDQGALAKRDIVYNIVEGPRVKVNKLTFTGNKLISNGKLKGETKTRTYFPIFRKGVLGEDQLEKDRLAISSYYYDQGFLDARCFVSATFNEKRTRAQVDFVIEEGVLYRVASIHFQGNNTYSKAELAEAFSFEIGDRYKKEAKALAIKSIKRLYGKDGYIYCEVRVTPEFTEEEGQVAVVVSITEGTAFRLGKIVIQGNNQTQDKVARRDLDRVGFTSGGMYNSDAADKGRRRLGGSGKFDQVVIEPIGDDEKTRDALVTVQEKLTGMMSLGLGIGSDNGLTGQFSIRESNFDTSQIPKTLNEYMSGKRNMRGGGQRMEFNFQPGTRETRGRFSFHNPYVNDQPIYFDMSLFLVKTYRETWEESRRGGKATFGKRFDNLWNCDISFRAERVEVDYGDRDRDTVGVHEYNEWAEDAGEPLEEVEDPPQDVFTAPSEVKALKGYTMLTSIKLGLGKNSTDRRIRPTEGYKLNTSWEQYGVMGGELYFGAYNVGGSTYVTLHEDIMERRTIWSSRFRYSQIIGDAPVFEKFYAGGLSSLRGFEYRGIGERSGFYNDPIGSESMVVLGTEVIKPLFEETFYGKIFCDSALPDDNEVRLTIGLGVEIMIPQLFQEVPMQLNIGYPVMSQDYDDEESFSFSFGTQF